MKKSHTLISLAFLFSFGSSLQAEIPLVNPLDFSSEYEIDLHLHVFDPAWEEPWWGSTTGYRTTGGSLEIRHIRHFQEAKTRFQLLENRFWFRFRYRADELVNTSVTESAIELEYSPFRHWYFSQTAQLAFHKKDIDLGWAVRYGTTEAESIRLEYVLVDFDANFAFDRKSVDEGFEEFNNRAARQIRVRGSTFQSPLKIMAQGIWTSPWEKERIDLSKPADRALTSGKDSFIQLRTWLDLAPLKPALDVEYRSEESGQNFIPARPAEGYQTTHQRAVIRPYFLFDQDAWHARVGTSFVDTKGTSLFPGDPARNRDFHTKHVLPFILVQRQWNKMFLGEIGYFHDAQFRKKNIGGFADEGRQSENQLKLSVEIRFPSANRLKIMTGWEMDKNDFGRAAYFDGAHAQFQAMF